MSKVAIVILNWNGLNYLKQFLPSVMEHSSVSGHEVEVAVADNGSTDGSIQWLEESKMANTVIRLNRNFGFAQGYNLALQKVEAEYYLLLNSDVEVGEGWLQPLVDFMDSTPHAAACMPKILNHSEPMHLEFAGAAGGFIDYLGYPFCRGRILDATEQDDGQYDQTIPVFWATGACLMLRSNCFWEAGGFDPNFFAHMEEIDLCWRLKRMGHSVWCIPKSSVLHVGGGSLPSSNPRKAFLNHRNNLLMLLKNLAPIKAIGIIPLRLLLDLASASIYLLSGRFSFAVSVIKSHLHFVAMLPLVISQRRVFSSKYGYKVSGGIYPKSILSQYFLYKRRKFSQLPGVGAS